MINTGVQDRARCNYKNAARWSVNRQDICIQITPSLCVGIAEMRHIAVYRLRDCVVFKHHNPKHKHTNTRE